MNFSREIQTPADVLQLFLGRFQLLPQHCPAALNLGFKFIVRYVHYHPNFPFVANQTAMPFKDEGSATRFHQQKIESAFSKISQFTEESRQHYIKNMVREDEQNNWTTQPTYDALLIRYLPKLLPALDRHLHPQKAEPLPAPTTDVSRFCTKLENKLNKSLKTVEFLVAYCRTKGKNLSRFIENYTARLKADSEWVTTWVDIWCKYVFEKNGFNKIVR